MNESERKNRLEKVSREIYPNIRRNAKLNVHAMEVIIRYFKWIRRMPITDRKFEFLIKTTRNPDYSKYERKLAKYKKELGFRNPNVIIMTIYTQLIAEKSYKDLTDMASMVGFSLRGRFNRYLTYNCPSYEAIMSAFDLFRITAVDQSDRSNVDASNIMSYMESFMLMDNIRTYSESRDVAEVRYKWAGRVYIKEITYPYLGEKKYTVSMDVNLRSRYISELMGIRICRYLTTKMSDLDKGIMSSDFLDSCSRIDSIISGDKSITEPSDVLTLNSSYQDSPSSLMSLVEIMKNIMKGITKIDFKSQDIESEELNELIKELKTDDILQ